MRIDILKMEIERKLPYWLSAAARGAHRRLTIRAKHRARYQAKRAADRAALAHDRGFNPNEPRDRTGKWTTGGAGGAAGTMISPAPKAPVGGTIFASPNTKTLKFNSAQAALSGARQKQMAEAFRSVASIVGLKVRERPALGAWADGAENSIISDVEPTTFDKLEAAAAMMGALANQKAVLAFQAGAGDNSHFLASFPAKGSLNAIHRKLLADGLAFHTLEPTEGGAVVHIYGSDAETLKKAHDAGDSYGADTDVRFGTGKFVGSSKEDGTDDAIRSDAQAIYEGAIRSYAASPAAGPNFGAAWEGLRHRWADIGRPRQDARGRFTSSGDKDADLTKNAWANDGNLAFTNIDQVVKAAPANQRALQAAGAAVAEKLPGVIFKKAGAKTTVKDTDESHPKGIERVQTKAKTRGLGGVTDVTRIGFIIEKPDQKDAIVDGLRQHFEVIDEGWQRNEWGYWDAKALVRYPDGMIGEVQIMEKNLERAKSSKGDGAGHGHELPDSDPKRKALVTQSQKVYAAAIARSDPGWRKVYERSPMKA